jgi:hypothetical protein
LKKEYGNKLEVCQRREIKPCALWPTRKKYDGATGLLIKLEATINGCVCKFQASFFGRMDVMYNTFEELENGKKLRRSRIKWCGKANQHIYMTKGILCSLRDGKN